MITKKVMVTTVIVHDLMYNKEKNVLTYMIGNDINRKIYYDSSQSLGENIMSHENILSLEDLESKKDPHWYTGVSRLIIAGGYGNIIPVH